MRPSVTDRVLISVDGRPVSAASGNQAAGGTRLALETELKQPSGVRGYTVMSTAIPMTRTTARCPAPLRGRKSRPRSHCVSAGGWGRSPSTATRTSARSAGAMSTSLILHGASAGRGDHSRVRRGAGRRCSPRTIRSSTTSVFLQDPGPGGGGGGSPAPAPPKKLEVPKHEAPSVVPIPVPAPPVDPPPTLRRAD